MSLPAGILNYRHVGEVFDTASKYIGMYRSGELVPLKTRINTEGTMIGGLIPEDMLVLAGRSGTGKTSRLNDMFIDFFDEKLNPSYKDKLMVFYDSWEMSDYKNVLKMISAKKTLDIKQILSYKEMLLEEHFEAIKAMKKDFAGMPLYIGEEIYSPKRWLKKRQELKKLYPNHTLIHAGDHTRFAMADEEKSEQEKLSNLMLACVKHKKASGDMVIWLTQMNRNIETGVDRKDLGKSSPIASDIFGSDAVMQNADLVLALSRPGMYGVETWNGYKTGFAKDGSTKDHLVVGTVIKNRMGDLGDYLYKHELKYNRFRSYTANEIAELRVKKEAA